MKKKIVCILIVISIFIGMLLYTYFTPGSFTEGRSLRPIISVTLLSAVMAKKIYDDKFSKIDVIILLVGVLVVIIAFFYLGLYKYL